MKVIYFFGYMTIQIRTNSNFYENFQGAISQYII